MEQQPDPSPDEIAAACERIRSTWSVDERRSRMGKTPPLQESDFVGVEAATAVRLEDRLEAMRGAMAS